MIGNKEGITISEKPVAKEADVLVDLRKSSEVPKEVKTWMQKVEEAPSAPTQINQTASNDDFKIAKPKIKLPIGKKRFAAGFKSPVSTAARWLSVFILRLIKINEARVKFEDE
ncbi:MAG TPA: hypothetical protein PK370_02815 [Candidatus Woesebacteria bacterium]|nr:hypothetical protein [Candidatus Woesebacteria bacterium]HPJ16643.1 hypothetical protein [Candidatus Woesebacteria bacterium]